MSCRQQTPTAAARSDLVVVKSPFGTSLTGLIQRLNPALIQALVPKRAVKAPDVGVLCWTARLDQDVLSAVLLSPSHKCPASELRPVVSPDILRVIPKHGGTVQQAGDLTPANAKVSCDVHALVREVVCHC